MIPLKQIRLWTKICFRGIFIYENFTFFTIYGQILYFPSESSIISLNFVQIKYHLHIIFYRRIFIMNIIIVGCGKVGISLAERLSAEGHDLVMVDINAKRVEEVSGRFDLMGIV